MKIYLYLGAAAEFFSGQHKEALASVDHVLERSPGLRFARVLRVAVLMTLGQTFQAAANRRHSPAIPFRL